jgi:hypothetical protein
MSGHNRKKKDGERQDSKIKARQRDFEQPVIGAVTPQSGRDTSNFTDGDIAGPDWRRKLRAKRSDTA